MQIQMLSKRAQKEHVISVEEKVQKYKESLKQEEAKSEQGRESPRSQNLKPDYDTRLYMESGLVKE